MKFHIYAQGDVLEINGIQTSAKKYRKTWIKEPRYDNLQSLAEGIAIGLKDGKNHPHDPEIVKRMYRIKAKMREIGIPETFPAIAFELDYAIRFEGISPRIVKAGMM